VIQPIKLSPIFVCDIPLQDLDKQAQRGCGRSVSPTHAANELAGIFATRARGVARELLMLINELGRETP